MRLPAAQDVLTWGGLAVLGVGVWRLSPAVALIVVGTVCLALGLIASRPRMR